MELPERKCVVCGVGSHRTDWANRTPACDHHSEAEVREALAKLAPKQTPAKPNGGGK